MVERQLPKLLILLNSTIDYDQNIERFQSGAPLARQCPSGFLYHAVSADMEQTSASIFQRGPAQHRVLIRRNGIKLCQTFETRREAEEWARITKGKVTGGEVVEKRTPVSLSVACKWMENQVGSNADARNLRGHLRYWSTSKFASWAITAIHDWDVIEWRRKVLDEANAEDEGVGPEAAFGAQTCIHRMNALSKPDLGPGQQGRDR